MEAILNSPLFALVPLFIGLIVGWLLRESMLLKEFNAKLAQIERDRDFARTESETLREQVSLLEADMKKAAFDNQEISGRLELAETDRFDLQKIIRDQKSAFENSKKEVALLKEKLTGQDEQIIGLRTRLGQMNDQTENFIEKEEAEKRIHEDLAVAAEKLAALEKQLALLTATNTKLGHEKESLHTQLLDYQLKNAEMPGLLAATNGNGSTKVRTKKGAEQPAPTPQNGHLNGESGPEKSSAPAIADDLKIINTITAAQESELLKLGISTIEQLANLSEKQLLEIAEGSSRLAKKMQKEDWVGQARHVLGAV